MARRLWVAVFMLFLVLGCNHRSSDPKAFLKDWRSVADEFLATGTALDAAPPPDLRGLSRARRSQVLGDEVIKDAARYEALVPRARALQPPRGYEGAKAVMVEMIEGTARYMREWGQALKTQDKAHADAAGKRLDEHCLSSMDRMIKFMADQGVDVSNVKALRRRTAEKMKG